MMRTSSQGARLKKIYKNYRERRRARRARKDNSDSNSHDGSNFEFNQEQMIPFWAAYFQRIEKWEEEESCQSHNSVLADIDEASID